MTTTVKFAGYQGDHSVHTRAARVLQSSLQHDAGSDISFVFDKNIAEQGYKAADLLTRTESGEIDGCYFSSSYLAARVPELGLFDQHFVVPDRRHAYATLDGKLGKRLAQEVERKTGFSVLGFWDNGLRHISSARGAIRTPDDCQGQKIRTLSNDNHQRVFRALGFEPTSIDVRDLPSAVESFKVDAQENPLTNIYNFGLHKTHKNITLTGHLLGVALVLFNAEVVHAWPEKVRAAVTRAITQATAAQRRFAEEDDTVCAKAIKADGCEIIELTHEERAAFIESTTNTVTKTRADFSEELISLFEEDLASVKA